MPETHHLSQREISRKYDRFARWYDWVEGIPELLGVNRLRYRMLQRANGTVLEVAIGTGKNLPYYPCDCRIIGTDASIQMLAIAQTRASQLQLNISFLLANAEALPFPDETFDTVVSSLSTCTFPDPVAALIEMARVCGQRERFFCWSMAEAIASGLEDFRTARRIDTQSNSAAIGTENLWSL